MSFFEDVKKGIYVKKDYSETQSGSPSKIAYIYKSKLDFISRCILDYKNIETGGQLFGYWTADGSPVVVYAIGPGSQANHHDISVDNKASEKVAKKCGFELRDRAGFMDPEHPEVGLRRHWYKSIHLQDDRIPFFQRANVAYRIRIIDQQYAFMRKLFKCL